MRTRSGFRNERHNGLKVGIAVIALAGFGAGWALFAETNADASAAGAAPPAPATTVAIPTTTTRQAGGASSRPPTATPTSPIVAPTPAADPTVARARRSRAS
jgi:hypothetical protein